jgi:hypothetical protein
VVYSPAGSLVARKRRHAHLTSYVPANLQRSPNCTSYLPLDVSFATEFHALRNETRLPIVNSLVDNVVKHLIECVLLSNECWILVTQFEVYLPHHQLDDCARDENPSNTTKNHLRLHKLDKKESKYGKSL